MIWLMTPAQKPIPSPGYFQENPSLVRPKAQKRIEADTFLLTGQDFQLEFVNYCRWDNHWTTMEKNKKYLPTTKTPSNTVFWVCPRFSKQHQ